jgi:hypothetical protein
LLASHADGARAAAGEEVAQESPATAILPHSVAMTPRIVGSIQVPVLRSNTGWRNDHPPITGLGSVPLGLSDENQSLVWSAEFFAKNLEFGKSMLSQEQSSSASDNLEEEFEELLRNHGS